MTNQKKLFNKYKAEYNLKNPDLQFPKVIYFAEKMFGKKTPGSNLFLWNRFMRGETKLLSPDQIKNFCECVGISSDEFIYSTIYERVRMKYKDQYNVPHDIHGEITGYGRKIIVFMPFGGREILIEKSKVIKIEPV